MRIFHDDELEIKKYETFKLLEGENSKSNDSSSTKIDDIEEDLFGPIQLNNSMISNDRFLVEKNNNDVGFDLRFKPY